MVRAISILGALSLCLLISLDRYVCLFLDIPMFFNKPYIVIYTILWLVFEYIVFFPGGRYKAIFNEFDKQIHSKDEVEMQCGKDIQLQLVSS